VCCVCVCARARVCVHDGAGCCKNWIYDSVISGVCVCDNVCLLSDGVCLMYHGHIMYHDASWFEWSMMESVWDVVCV
jgi:hypothetical protein